MGTVTVTLNNTGIRQGTEHVGARKESSGLLAGSASYATSGDSYTADQFGMSRVDSLQLTPHGGGASHRAEWDKANLKVLVYVESSDAEVTNATDISAEKWEFTAIGK